MGHWTDYVCTASDCLNGCARCKFGRRQSYVCDKCKGCNKCIELVSNRDCNCRVIEKCCCLP